MVTFLDYRPHCVLEVRETGDGRLQRIFELMRTCRISIHDMSRIGAPVRFNMPFELGLACSLQLNEPQHYDVLVFDSRPYRLDRRLSDYKGRDLYIHGGTSSGMVAALLDAFQSRRVEESRLRNALRDLSVFAERLKRDLRVRTIFQPYLFSALLNNATHLAADYGFIRP